MDLSTQSDESENILRKYYSERASSGSCAPNIGYLKQCLKEMLAIRSNVTKYIVIDALDVMSTHGNSSPREKTLELMSWLIGLGIPGLRICITSRPEDDIGQVLRSLASHQVVLDEEQEHREDIAHFIRSTVETSKWSMRGWRDTAKQEVISVLSEKADGMFQYVSCQLGILSDSPFLEIEPTLRSLPTALHATYESTLERISEDKWKHAHRLFQCLLFSTRPLSVEELAEVLAINFDEEIPTYHNDRRPTSRRARSYPLALEV
ncbi:hypothetical protein BC834DRAFT_343379 [Gloeopeniophorella convolvens]|nr:hypothetical protein BC834DRAFT_343379 [Gloeopeniophorella convolvens]